jgi:hypothetical protein
LPQVRIVRNVHEAEFDARLRTPDLLQHHIHRKVADVIAGVIGEMDAPPAEFDFNRRLQPTRAALANRLRLGFFTSAPTVSRTRFKFNVSPCALPKTQNSIRIITPERLEKLTAMKAHWKHLAMEPQPNWQRLDDLSRDVVLELSVWPETVNQYSPVSIHGLSETAA